MQRHGTRSGEKVVLVRLETSPEDIEGMKAAQGILTVRGGMTSHAAVVARGMGTCCVSGCGDYQHGRREQEVRPSPARPSTRATASLIDGSTGNIYDGIIPTVDASIAGEFGRIMAWADKYRHLQVRTNADTPHDASKARELRRRGHRPLPYRAHVLRSATESPLFREMICADTVEEQRSCSCKARAHAAGRLRGAL